MLARIILAFTLAISAFAVQPVFDTFSETEASASSHGATVEVQPGDTLSSIAADHGTTVQALVEANQIDDPDLIHVEQVLQIPGEGGVPNQQVTPPEGADLGGSVGRGRSDQPDLPGLGR